MIWVLVITLILTDADGKITSSAGSLAPHASERACEATKAEVSAAIHSEPPKPGRIVIMGCSRMRLPANA